MKRQQRNHIRTPENANGQLPKRDERRIHKLIAKESSVFVPETYSRIERKLGINKPDESVASLEVAAQLAFESENVSNKKKDITLAKAGVVGSKWSAFFPKRGIVLGGIAIVAIGSVGLTAVLLNGKTIQADAATTYVTVAITPASAGEATSDDHGIVSSNAPSSVNAYSPAFSFDIKTGNLADAESLTAQNYSASIIAGQVKKADVQAAEFIKRLLPIAYDNGYLETIDPTLSNIISVSIVSDDLDYLANNQADYQSAIAEYLTEGKIYGSIQFSDRASTSAEFAKYVSEFGASKAKLIYHLYNLLAGEDGSSPSYVASSSTSEGDGLGDLDTRDFKGFAAILAKLPDGLAASLETTLTVLRQTPLSPLALHRILAGLRIAVAHYLNDGTTGNADELLMEKSMLQKVLYEEYEDNPALFAPLMGSITKYAQSDFMDDSFYMAGLGGFKERPLLDGKLCDSHVINTFITIRNDIIFALNEERFDSLMVSMTARINESIAEGKSVFPDSESPDGGHHSHGYGPQNDADWGNGGPRS